PEADAHVPGHEPGAVARIGAEATHDPDSFTGGGGAEGAGGRLRGPQLVAVSVGADVGPHAESGVDRVGDEGDDAVESAAHGRLEAIVGALGERRGEEQETEGEESDVAPGDG